MQAECAGVCWQDRQCISVMTVTDFKDTHFDLEIKLCLFGVSISLLSMPINIPITFYSSHKNERDNECYKIFCLCFYIYNLLDQYVLCIYFIKSDEKNVQLLHLFMTQFQDFLVNSVSMVYRLM